MPAIRKFLRIEKILFLANVIALSNLENTYNYTARTKFNRDSPKINLKIYLLLHFMCNHPETFRICSRDHLETLALVALFDFENLGSGKITKKPGSIFSKSNNFGFEALIKKNNPSKSF